MLEQNNERELFSLYPYTGSALESGVIQLIEEGTVREDVLFLLASFGHQQTDKETEHRLSWLILKDIVTHARNPDDMRADTLALLTKEAMPDAIIDWNLRLNDHVRKSFEHMYYSVGDLAGVLGEHTFAHVDDKDEGYRRSRAVAKGLWRAVVARHHPEWLSDHTTYFAPRISFETVYDSVSDKTMKSRIIGHAVLGDPLIYDTYLEAKTTGVKGIAEKGIESLQLLLSEEHPELLWILVRRRTGIRTIQV